MAMSPAKDAATAARPMPQIASLAAMAEAALPVVPLLGEGSVRFTGLKVEEPKSTPQLDLYWNLRSSLKRSTVKARSRLREGKGEGDF